MPNNIIIRLVIYYITWIVVLNTVFHVFPEILYYVAQERERIFVGKSLGSGADSAIPLGNIKEGVNRLLDPAHTIPVVVALVLAFAVTLPITWVYAWTRPLKKYSQSFAHTLLVMPVAISLVVFLVKGSLALAFSLAGIVAAVSFRISLKETMDAVYMFMVIGIGLAAGTQLTTVAYIASLAFVTITLSVWKTNYAARPPVLSGWRIVSPTKPTGSSATGDTASGDTREFRIAVHATNVNAAQKVATPILDYSAIKWNLSEVIENEDGTVVVVYEVTSSQSVDHSSIIRDVGKRGKKQIKDVELIEDETDQSL
ncbi:MAG: DUF4956 domain-containing protein [Gemmatimonadota bacterium]|nr:DUF4956 domain-containing protein [Gemmatimonadota bacterium]